MLTSARGRAIWRVDDEDRVPGEELIGRQPAFSRLDGDRKSHLLEAAERERRIRLENGVTAPGGINGVTERHALVVGDKDDKRCHAPEISRKALSGEWRRAPELTVTRCCPSPGFVAPKRVLPESV